MRRRSLPFLRATLTSCLALMLGAGAATAQPADGVRDTLLQADEVSYDEATDTVVASGRVEIAREGSILLADRVTYERGRDVVTATGNVSLIEPNGTALFVEKIEVTSDLNQALASELRVLLSDKSRMTGRAFRRRNASSDELYEAAYTACDVCEGRDPVWQVNASQVRRDADKQMIYYNDVWLNLLGVPVFYTPYLAHPDPSAGRKSGLLLPIIGGGSNLGLSYMQPYYVNIAPDKDATLSPLVTTSAGKGATVEYRQDFRHGRLNFFGSGVAGDPATPGEFRGHIRSWARWDMTEDWRSGADVNLATDQTYLRRYNFDQAAATWLTTNAFAERFGRNSYFSANAYYFQRQRNVIAQPTPIISPLLYYNYTTDPLPWGGFLEIDASGVVLSRVKGNDAHRLSATASYHLPFTTRGGHLITARAAFRADGYYVSNYLRPGTARPFSGTTGRTVPEASIEWRWPLARSGDDFTQVIEPIIMGVITPIGINPDEIPNEDSRDFEFDDTNLFETQRFTGYDRVEEGARVSYGVRWAAYNRRGGILSAMVGQSYRFQQRSAFTALSGLNRKLSDYVGRVDVSPNEYISLQYRFRLDKDSLDNRRSEVNALLGPDLFRLGIGYIDILPTATVSGPAESRRELYTALSTKVTQYWAVRASHRENLAPGGGSIRTDVVLSYEDECFAFDLTVARDNTSDRDFRSGVGVLLRFSLKTIGDLRVNTDVGLGR
jgi:LPS-assembly protein